MFRLVRADDPSIRIVGILEQVFGIAYLESVTDDDVEYTGETMLYWDDQAPVIKDGHRVFVDENEEFILESKVKRIPIDGHEI